MKLPRNRQYTVRLMAPFNMRCQTCGEYIYKGKKFNARKEDVEGEDYLGIRIYRFYIKCTRCLQEISFKTDPKNTDYEIEAGATRNFMALKLAEEQAQREEDEKKEEEANNPMKLLENRTQQSKQELELLESLEELKDLNRRQQSINFDAMLSQFDTREAKEKILKMQEEDDERFIKSVFGKEKKMVKEVIIEDVEDEKSADKSSDCDPPPAKSMKLSSSTSSFTLCSSSTTTSDPSTISNSTSDPLPKASSLLTTKPVALKPADDDSWSKSVGLMSRKPGALSGLVKIKSQATVSKEVPSESSSVARPVSSSLSMLSNYTDSDDTGSD
ncbi:splicing factor YJU2 isoform X2 [Nilaparvata lugens]|nr:splicing factor YJU2 isoform X2 [Nilaparvata lugens]